MKKFKKLSVMLSLVLCISILFTSNVFALEEKNNLVNEYNESLSKMGIDYETYKNMPKDKQNMFNVEIKEAKSIIKYYRISTITGQQLKAYGAINQDKMEEIDEQQFLIETTNYMENSMIKTLSSDNTNVTWMKMKTTLGKGVTNEWFLTNDVTYVCDPYLTSNTHVLGLGTNANFSIINNSEYLTRKYDVYNPLTSTFERGFSKDYMTATKRQASGYAYSIHIPFNQWNNQYIMALRIKPNVSNVTVCDGFGHFGRYSKKVSPNLSFSAGGANLSISPTSGLDEASTHVQMIV